jgi:hypothetical protein
MCAAIIVVPGCGRQAEGVRPVRDRADDHAPARAPTQPCRRTPITPLKVGVVIHRQSSATRAAVRACFLRTRSLWDSKLLNTRDGATPQNDTQHRNQLHKLFSDSFTSPAALHKQPQWHVSKWCCCHAQPALARIQPRVIRHPPLRLLPRGPYCSSGQLREQVVGRLPLACPMCLLLCIQIACKPVSRHPMPSFSGRRLGAVG